jgi:hypothetical protein
MACVWGGVGEGGRWSGRIETKEATLFQLQGWLAQPGTSQACTARVGQADPKRTPSGRQADARPGSQHRQPAASRGGHLLHQLVLHVQVVPAQVQVGQRLVLRGHGDPARVHLARRGGLEDAGGDVPAAAGRQVQAVQLRGGGQGVGKQAGRGAPVCVWGGAREDGQPGVVRSGVVCSDVQ